MTVEGKRLPLGGRTAVSLRTRRRVLRAMSVLFGISVCALLGSAAASVFAFIRGAVHWLHMGPTTRYAEYIGESQTPLRVPLHAVPQKDVDAAYGETTDARIAYSGFSHLICPGLLAAVVVPSAAHCRALCVANSPPCAAFTFTPAGRCYLHTPVKPSADGFPHIFQDWYAEDVPGMVSGTVVGPSGSRTDSVPTNRLPQALVATQLCDRYDALPRLQKINAVAFADTLQNGQYVYLPHSPEGRLFEKARDRLNQVKRDYNGHPRRLARQRLLLSVGIDCCQHSKVLHAATGLAFGGFDAVIQPGREQYGLDFAAAYNRLVHERRGAGYWVWKPYFLLRTLLELAQDDDLVFYGDAGTYFHTDASVHRQMEWNFLYNQSHTARGSRQDVLVYAEGSPEWQRTKSDLINAALVGLSAASDSHSSGQREVTGGSTNRRGDYESTSGRDAILQSSQVSATWVIVRRSPQSIAFVNDWLSACLDDRGRLLSDDPSTPPSGGKERTEARGFLGHRHDQSVLSLIYKRWGFLPADFPMEGVTHTRDKS